MTININKQGCWCSNSWKYVFLVRERPVGGSSVSCLSVLWSSIDYHSPLSHSPLLPCNTGNEAMGGQGEGKMKEKCGERQTKRKRRGGGRGKKGGDCEVTALHDLWVITPMWKLHGPGQWWERGRWVVSVWLGNPNVFLCVCWLPSFNGSRVIATLSLPLPRLTRWGVAVWTFSPFPVSIKSRGGDYKHQSRNVIFSHNVFITTHLFSWS